MSQRSAPTTSTRRAGHVHPADLARNRLLAVLGNDALEAVCRRTELFQLSPRQVLIEQDDRSSDVFIVLSGSVRIVVFSPAGRAVLFRDLGPGELIGEISAIDGKPRSATVEALAPAQVGRIPGPVFRDLVTDEPALALGLLHLAIRYVRELTERVYELSAMTVASRIHAELLRLAHAAPTGDGGEIVLAPAPRHADIADRVGTQREAVSREFAHLARIGIIARRGRSLVVDAVRLASLAGGPAGA